MHAWAMEGSGRIYVRSRMIIIIIPASLLVFFFSFPFLLSLLQCFQLADPLVDSFPSFEPANIASNSHSSSSVQQVVAVILRRSGNCSATIAPRGSFFVSRVFPLFYLRDMGGMNWRRASGMEGFQTGKKTDAAFRTSTVAVTKKFTANRFFIGKSGSSLGITGDRFDRIKRPPKAIIASQFLPFLCVCLAA